MPFQTRRNSVAKPTLADLQAAREMFEAVEPRNLFYRLSLHLMEQAEGSRSLFSRAEALAVLLQTWNRSYYQRLRIPFDAAHFAAIEHLLVEHEQAMAEFAGRSIDSLTPVDEAPVRAVYDEFEAVLGQTGASKALHLLAPRFFPLWDGAIAATAYGLYARDARDYWRLLCATAEQVEAVGGEAALDRNPIKAIDEYNYCRYTLKRIT
ncbi:MAG TPA: hypothetical protein VF293_05285 [Candidatus Limnocylindrales bacterium]